MFLLDNNNKVSNLKIEKSLDKSIKSIDNKLNITFYENRAVLFLKFIFFDIFGNLISDMSEETLYNYLPELIKFNKIKKIHSNNKIIKYNCNFSYISSQYIFEIEFLEFANSIKIEFNPILKSNYSIRIKGLEKTFEEKLKDVRKEFKMLSGSLNIYFNRSNPKLFLEKIKNKQNSVYKSNLHVNFSNEKGIDAGGPRKEFVYLLFKDLLNNKGII